MRLLALLALLAAAVSAAYIDGVVIALKQCLCLAPRWAYIDVWAHVAAQKPLDVALYWFDGSWSGPCHVGTGPTAHNTCSIPLTASAVALSLLDGGEEVDRIEIWGVKIANVTACDAQPLLEVVNKTTSYAPPSAVVTVRARWINPIQVHFAAANYTAFRSISVVDLNPCNDYVIKLWFRTPTPSPWHITLYGNYTPISPIVVTTTVTHTVTQTVTQRATETVAQTATATVTKTETLTVTHTSERVYTTTVTEVVKEVDIRGVALAFLGVGTLGLALVVFILSGRRGHVQEVRRA